VIARGPDEIELEDSWVEADESTRWRSGAALNHDVGARDSGTVVLEVDPGCRLESHRDSAEETIVVLDGEADVLVDGDRGRVRAGEVALIPADAPHEVRNAGRRTLRFVAAYARPDVRTTYERSVQPGGVRERDPLG
jgi:quercetin dioxygenase-like cupin family protein